MKTLAGANPSLSIINKTKANQENTVIKTKPVVKTGLVRQPKRETKSLLMSMRIRPSTKEKFDKLRKLYRYSQSDFFDALVAIAEEQAVSDGYKINS